MKKIIPSTQFGTHVPIKYAASTTVERYHEITTGRAKGATAIGI